jgi:Winged helix DNA-binding domain
LITCCAPAAGPKLARVETLTRARLTAALAARQLLIQRRRLPPAEAIRRLTPLQAQHPPAPYIALAARLDGFTREALEGALARRRVVKTTINRMTLHLANAADYPAYAQLTRHARMRLLRRDHSHLDEERVVADLSEWLREPRTNTEIRERVGRYGVGDQPWAPVMYARSLLPLVQVPPAGAWSDTTRGAGFVIHDGPLPDPLDAAALVVERYLAAFGPASRRDIGAWAGVTQRDFVGALERLPLVSFRDEEGTELLDLRRRPLPPESTPLPVRFLAHWDQALLAYAQRDRIIPPEVLPLQLTLSGDPTVTVDGRVAASWRIERDGEAARIVVTPHVDLRRSARPEIRAEAERTARFCEPDARTVSVTGV